MSIIVEDGSIVAGANSFASRAELIAFGAERGITIADVDASDVFLIKANDYIESLADRFSGTKTNPSAQTLQYPRTDVYVEGFLIDQNEIPPALKAGFLMLALNSKAGVDLSPTSSGLAIIREKVGPLDTTFSESSGSRYRPSMPAVDAYLNRFLNAGTSALVTRKG